MFYSIKDASAILDDNEPVIVLSSAGDVKIYPLMVMMWHEIVNDVIGNLPVTVTYCPLCNTGIAFDRRTEFGTLDFGTTGRLRYSNLIMYDRQTESWWQQAVQSFPEALVLSTDTGLDRPYGLNPYIGYDSSSEPFLYTGPAPGDEHQSLDRVLAIETSNKIISIAYSKLEKEGIGNFEDEKIVVFYDPDTASALDNEIISEGRKTGSALAFSTKVDDEYLSFYVENGSIFDNNTGSLWSVSGICLSGPLRGHQLTPVVSINHFWFSFNAFYSP